MEVPRSQVVVSTIQRPLASGATRRLVQKPVGVVKKITGNTNTMTHRKFFTLLLGR